MTAIKIEISLRLVRYLIIKLLTRAMSIDCMPLITPLFLTGNTPKTLVKCFAESTLPAYNLCSQQPTGVTQVTRELTGVTLGLLKDRNYLVHSEPRTRFRGVAISRGGKQGAKCTPHRRLVLRRNPPSVDTATLRSNRQCAPSKRPVAFVSFEKCQPEMVLSEHLFKFLLVENHARGRKRIRFSSRIGEGPGTVLSRRSATCSWIKDMGSLDCQPRTAQRSVCQKDSLRRIIFAQATRPPWGRCRGIARKNAAATGDQQKRAALPLAQQFSHAVERESLCQWRPDRS